MTPVRIGLAGYGRGGRYFHAPLIGRAPECTLAGVLTRSPQRRAELAADFPGVPAFGRLSELAGAGIDAVVITTPLAADVTTEHPGRTFALTDLLVRASWRRQGIAAALHDLILAGRPEERATLTVWPAAAPAQSAFAKWGWRKVARTRDSRPGNPVADVLVTTLPAQH